MHLLGHSREREREKARRTRLLNEEIVLADDVSHAAIIDPFDLADHVLEHVERLGVPSHVSHYDRYLVIVTAVSVSERSNVGKRGVEVSHFVSFLSGDDALGVGVGQTHGLLDKNGLARFGCGDGVRCLVLQTSQSVAKTRIESRNALT